MRKIICIMLTALLLCSSALAATAIPNQKLFFRTGPNTMYTEIFTIPKSTRIEPLAYEEGNGVVWVLCEFEYNNQIYHGYTGLKRMDVQGYVPWADNWASCSCVYDDTIVYAAPSPYAARRDILRTGEYVAVLQSGDNCGEYDSEMSDSNYLNFDDDYAFVEYRDADTGMLSRGWVLNQDLAATGTVAGRIIESCSLYAEDCRTVIGKVQKNTFVYHHRWEGSTEPYSWIDYYNPSTGEREDGYVATRYIEVY